MDSERGFSFAKARSILKSHDFLLNGASYFAIVIHILVPGAGSLPFPQHASLIARYSASFGGEFEGEWNVGRWEGEQEGWKGEKSSRLGIVSKRSE